MFRTESLIHAAAPSPMATCIARPARFPAQARSAHGAFGLEGRDSAMPARFRIA